jgi:hypothetical protein
MAKNRTALCIQTPLRSISATIAVVTIAVVMVFRPTAITVALSPFAMVAPLATAVIDHRRWSIVTRRFVNHGRGCSPTKRVDIDVYVGEGGSACRQRQRDNSK